MKNKTTPWALYAHKLRKGYKLVTTGHKAPISPHEWELIDSNVEYAPASAFMQEIGMRENYLPNKIKELWSQIKQENESTN